MSYWAVRAAGGTLIVRASRRTAVRSMTSLVKKRSSISAASSAGTTAVRCADLVSSPPAVSRSRQALAVGRATLYSLATLASVTLSPGESSPLTIRLRSDSYSASIKDDGVSVNCDGSPDMEPGYAGCTCYTSTPEYVDRQVCRM